MMDDKGDVNSGEAGAQEITKIPQGSQLKTVEEQLRNLQSALKATHKPAEEKLLMQWFKGEVEKTLAATGNDSECNMNLNKWAWKKADALKKEIENLKEQKKKKSVFTKRKVETAIKDKEEECRKWCTMALTWQSATHTMTQSGNTHTTNDNTHTSRELSGARPPPYDHSKMLTKPAPSLYPVLKVTSGILDVDHQDRYEEASAPLHWTECSPPRTHPESSSSRTQLDRVTEKMSKEKDDRDIEQVKQWTEGKPSRKGNTGQEQCEEGTKPVTFTGSGTMISAGKSSGVQVKLMATGKWLTDEEEEELRENMRKEGENSDKDDEGFEPTRSGKKRRDRRRKAKEQGSSDQMQTRSMTGEDTTMMPLVMSPGGGVQYTTFSLTDVEGLRAKLPPITEGGATWMANLLRHTSGMMLAVGDVRAIGNACASQSDWDQVEQQSGLRNQPLHQPMAGHWARLAAALRDKWPVRNLAPILKFPWSGTEDPNTYLNKAKEGWMAQTGENPDNPGVSQTFFRAAIVAGVPTVVSKALTENPDLLNATAPQWDRHCLHHLGRYAMEQDNQEKEKKDLELRVLKLQLADAKSKINKGKTGAEGGLTNQMLMTSGPANPDLYPIPPWEPPSQRSQGYPRGGYRGRGGPPRGGGRRQPPPQGCFVCGAPDHWARACPHKPRGPPRAPQRGRGRYQGRYPGQTGGQTYHDPQGYSELQEAAANIMMLSDLTDPEGYGSPQ